MYICIYMYIYISKRYLIFSLKTLLHIPYSHAMAKHKEAPTVGVL